MGEARRAAGQELPLAKEVMGRMERKAAVWQKLRWHSPRPVARVSVIVGGGGSDKQLQVCVVPAMALSALYFPYI